MTTTAPAVTAEVDRFLAERHALLDRPEGFARDLLDTLHDMGAFRVFIPRANGGLYERYSESLALVAMSACHSLELSLALGITSSLFVLPVSRYANPEARGRVLADFQKRRLLAGMMMTEPDFGTNIMGITMGFRAEGSGYRIRGAKHWAGLSGTGEYWLVSARKERDGGALGRDVDFFIVGSEQPGYTFEQRYPAAGLTSIQYGLNRFDVAVPADQKLCGPDSNIRILYDVLNRSRISISSIASGACRRILDDAVRNAGERVVFGKPIIAYEQVQHRLAGIQAASTICSCALSYVAAMLDAHEAPEPFLDILIANIIKVTTTDLLQASAQSAVQLRGGQGFRKDHYTGKAFVDSRPFQIFEGSNDVLYEAIAAQLQGEARKGGDKTLAETLARHPELPAPKLPDDGVGGQPTQGEDSQVDRVLLGKIISRYSAIGIVQHAAGVRPELAESATAFLRAECDGWQNERTSRHRARYVP